MRFASLLGFLMLLAACSLPPPEPQAPEAPPPSSPVVEEQEKEGAADGSLEWKGGGGVMERKEGAVMEKKTVEGEKMMEEATGRYVETYYTENGAKTLMSEVVGKGKPAVLNFSAAWCPTCKVAHAQFEKIYSEGGVTLSTYRVDYDHSAALQARYGVTTQHTMVLVDGQGKAVQTIVGPTEADLRMLLRKQG